MKHVSELYEQLVDSGRVTAVCRYNLRKFCRSFGLPPCGVSFWQMDDLNWDYLAAINGLLGHDQFRFRGGEHFPRTFLDHFMMGQTERTEYIFLTTETTHHLAWRRFFAHNFGGERRLFGPDREAHLPPCPLSLAAFFKNGLLNDLIHFGDKGDALTTVADFYLALYLMTRLEQPPAPQREAVFDGFKAAYPAYRADLARIRTTSNCVERLDDTLYLLEKLEAEP